MPTTTETRHEERVRLFEWFVARETGDLETPITSMITRMEREDVKQVEADFDAWKKKRQKK